MTYTSKNPSLDTPITQIWPEEFVHRYRKAGYWRGETMTGFLRHSTKHFAQQTALVGYTNTHLQRWTYEQFWQRVETAARGFLSLGLRQGECVVVQLGNIPEFYSVVFGLFRAGLVPVYSLPAHRLEDIAHFVNHSQASAYVAQEHYDNYDYRVLARNLIRQSPSLKHIIIAAGYAAEFISFDEFSNLTQLHTVELPENDVDPQSVAHIQISGGSTGRSKLIARTHDDYIYSIRASNDICNITAQSVYMVALPAAHNFPMSSPGALGAFYAGAKVVLSSTPSPETAFPLIEQEKVTSVGLVPPLALLWAQANQSNQHDLSSLQVLQVGGAKLTPEAARRVKKSMRCTIQQVFGMAEGLVNYTRLDDSDDLILQTQGRPISPDDEILVVDDHDQPLQVGRTGHLLTRGPYTIRAYHNNESANQRSFTSDGFYRTGDMVTLTHDGYLIVQGRANDHINRAGEKISAEEIEDYLLAHTDIFDAVVISVPDEFLGERSCAFIISKNNKPLRSLEIKQWMRKRDIAHFKIPDQIIFVKSFETTAAGKISRKELRAQLRQQLLG